MQAARYYGKHDIRIEDVPEPELLPGAVGIRPAFVGICGTDIHLYTEGPMPPAPLPGQVHPSTGDGLPVTLGHEISGTVESVGDGVMGFTPGDPVIVEALSVCGVRAQCVVGDYNLCAVLGAPGLPGGSGGLSEQVVIPARMVHKVGGIPLDEAALIEPLTVAVHGVRRSGAQAGDSAPVVGAGPVGVLVGAVLKGLRLRVTMSEPNAARRSVAERCGVADVVLDPHLEDSRAQLGKSLPAGGADVVFDCAASASALDVALSVLKPQRRPATDRHVSASAQVNLHRVATKELEIQGSFVYAGDHAAAIEMVR